MGKGKTDEIALLTSCFMSCFSLLAPRLEPLWDFTVKLTGVSAPFLSHCYCHQSLYSPAVSYFLMTFYFVWGYSPLTMLWQFQVDSLPVAQIVKNLPAMRETQVRSLGQEDPLEKEMATHSSILAWRIPWTEQPGGLQSMRSQRVRHNWETNTFTAN